MFEHVKQLVLAVPEQVKHDSSQQVFPRRVSPLMHAVHVVAELLHSEQGLVH